jgi:hypothetical protein
MSTNSVNKFHTSALSPSATAVGLFLAANESIKFETSSYELTPGLWETRKSRILFDLNPNRRVPGVHCCLRCVASFLFCSFVDVC